VLRGAETFGYRPAGEETDADGARRKNEMFLAAISGAVVARTDPARTGVSGGLAVQPQSPGLADRILWGSGTRATGQWAARAGMNLQSSTLLSEDTGVPFDHLQAEQIRLYREAWAEQGREREPRIGVAQRPADTVLFTVPNQLGVAYNARILETIATHIAPAIGWTPSTAAAPA
jgi:hypothetical protein